MTSVFFVLTLAMCLVAILLVALPLLRLNASQRVSSVYAPLLASATIIIASTALYAFTGRPDLIVREADAASRPSAQRAATSPEKSGSVGSLMAGLEARLHKNPDDAKGWLLAATSYEFLGRPEDARAALRRAQDLGLNDAELEQRLQASDAGPSAAAMIRGTVTLAPEAAELVSDTDVVYVIARDVNGPPAPLAVLRRSADELPFEYELSDENAMGAGSALSSAERIMVSAKITPNGDALNAREGLSRPNVEVETGRETVADLLITMDNMSGTTTQ